MSSERFVFPVFYLSLLGIDCIIYACKPCTTIGEYLVSASNLFSKNGKRLLPKIQLDYRGHNWPEEISEKVVLLVEKL